jgi:hypothetical protein
MGQSVLSPNSSSINTVPGSFALEISKSKSKMFKFGEDVNADSDEFDSDDAEMQTEYKPSWAEAPNLGGSDRIFNGLNQAEFGIDDRHQSERGVRELFLPPLSPDQRNRTVA